MSTLRPDQRMMIAACACIMLLTMGSRQTMGLFISPVNTATGLGVVAISFAFAVGQFAWGAAQPMFGALAGRIGTVRVLMIGSALLAAGIVMIPFARDPLTFLIAAGILMPVGAAAGSFSILIGATAGRLPPERRAVAAGIINAGGSLGQFIFAPLMQWLIATTGWVWALFSMAALTLLSLPLAWPLRARAPGAGQHTAHSGPDHGLRHQIALAMRDRSYLLLHAGFFTCGFHIGFLVTHLPGEVRLCGLPAAVSANALALIGLFNVAGSLSAGALAQHIRMKWLLAGMYGSRAVLIVLYLLAPKSATTTYLFAAGLGFTWLATVPPTAGLVGKLFGTRHLATLFGLTLLSHQIGAFFGAWLGGIALVRSGDYTWMWYADMGLAAFAALCNLPIREAPPRAAVAAAA